MRIYRFEALRLSAVAVAIATSIISCDSEDRISTTGTTIISQNTPTAMPQEIRRSDGGSTFLLADGWAIPSLAAAEREAFETSIQTAGGLSVKVNRTVIKIDSLLLFADHPLHLIGIGSKDILIHKVVEYRTSAGIFCYKFLVNNTYVDENTNEVRLTLGLLYAYKYYDEDGDGVFESLVINEKEDRFGHKGFESEPHVPKWAMN